MKMTRRRSIQVSAAALMMMAPAAKLLARERALSIILAPSNLGLRPPDVGHPPGAWRAPQALMAAGLAAAVGASQVLPLERPTYDFGPQPGTQIRNGQSIRTFSLKLSDLVRSVLEQGSFPLVIGGDCSILLGSLCGLRRWGGRGLVHIDGHSDFYRMSDQDSGRLGAAAGMDLALASGRGEALLTDWSGAGTLANDSDILQIGERESLDQLNRIPGTGIAQITAQRILAEGIQRAASITIEKLKASDIGQAWMHVDLDVLDQTVMPAVDSPGSPGLRFEDLAELVRALCASGRIAGADFAIYDPERDPGLRFARPIVDCIARGVGGLRLNARNA